MLLLYFRIFRNYTIYSSKEKRRSDGELSPDEGFYSFSLIRRYRRGSLVAIELGRGLKEYSKSTPLLFFN